MLSRKLQILILDYIKGIFRNQSHITHNKQNIMIYVVFIVTLLLNSVKTSTDGGACNETWVDASSVGLGYLWFDTSELMRYENAIKYCHQDRNSRLIDTPEQMDFTTKKLMPLNGKVLWQTYANGNYRWGGATD